MRIAWVSRRLAIWLILFVLLAPAASNAQSADAAAAWPHTLAVNGATVQVYQPQAISWPEHRKLTARAAIAISRPGENTPLLGTIDVTLDTETDPATGMVRLSDPKLDASHFPSLDTAQAARVDQQIRQALPNMQVKQVPLQTVLLSLKEKAPATDVPVENNPPVIFYSDKPASLVVFDGEPVMVPIGKTGLSYAVNTNWDVFTDGSSWFLLNNGQWLTAPSAEGPYKPTGTLPRAFSSLPADANFANVRKAIPPHAAGKTAPTIFVSTKPAEIIATVGAPQFAPVSGTTLQVVKNTPNTLFFQPSSGRFFVLFSGRWFAASGLNGPWRFATNELPPDFAMISPDSPQAAVLASVPGTTQAELAVMKASIPQQTTVKKDAAKLNVVYTGPPQFKPIPGTTMMYAVNTPFDVIETGGRYYVCYQGVWFTGPSPNGPWVLAESVPQVIYTIPPSSPLYPVTYVHVYAATPVAVTYGYTAGYTMGFVSAGVLVYGTGYYYPPVVIPGPVPIYYPYPYSYAGNVWYNTSNGAWARGGTIYGPYGGAATGGTYYNPSTGAWASGGAIYGPNGGAGAFSAYNPSTGGYARGSASWGPSGGSANANWYNPRTGVSGSTNQNWNPYLRTGSGTFSGPSQTVNTRSGSNAQGSAGAFRSTTGAEGAGYSTASGNRGGAVKTQGGDVYAGHDGNVYQHTSNGWSKWNNGGWQPATPPTRSASQSSSLGATQGGSREPIERQTYGQLEQDRQARFAGQGSGRFGGAHEGSGGGRFRR